MAAAASASACWSDSNLPKAGRSSSATSPRIEEITDESFVSAAISAKGSFSIKESSRRTSAGVADGRRAVVDEGFEASYSSASFRASSSLLETEKTLMSKSKE